MRSAACTATSKYADSEFWTQPGSFSSYSASPSRAQAEWEALELTDHQWALENVEEDLMSRELDFDGMFTKELPSGIF